MKKVFVLGILIVGGFFAAVWAQDGEPVIEGRAVWINPPGLITDDEAARAFVERVKKANINLIVMSVKSTQGRLYYQSELNPAMIDERFNGFDPLAAMVRETRRQGVKLHAWLCDFTDSPDNPVLKENPEWIAVNAQGKPTTSEFLGGGRPYTITWVCPARRPGYTDQYLLPLIEEIVRNYDVDGIHHDYVRYPGDVAPDGYCFDDYCLEEILKYNHFYYESFPNTTYEAQPTLPNPVANWWSDPTVKPPDWDKWDREAKAQFLLTGQFMRYGPSDLDYFFYTFRSDAITRFVREAWERAKAIKPDIEMSAAVFKNPTASGRFIGQRWTNFAPWVDIMMPMVYRSHFPVTDWETFLTQLEEYTRYEMRWSEGLANLSVGLDVHYIFREEDQALRDILSELSRWEAMPAAERRRVLSELRDSFGQIRERMAQFAPQAAKEIADGLAGLSASSDAEATRAVIDKVRAFRSDPPEGYYPGEKVKQVIGAVRKGGGEGVVLFDGRGIDQKKLWSALEEVFPTPSVEPFEARPAAKLSVVRLRQLEQKVGAIQRNFRFAGGAAVLFLVLWVVALIRRPRKTAE